MRSTFSAIACMALVLAANEASADEARDQLIVETVLKLDSFDYASASEKVKGSIGRYLEKNLGSDEYFQLVERFEISGEVGRLAGLASKEGADPRAARLLVALGGDTAIVEALGAAGEGRMALVEALGRVNDPKVVNSLEALLMGEDAALSSMAAKGLTGSPAGQARLLKLAEAEKLPQAVMEGVAIALSASADPKVRDLASRVLALPSALGGEKLAPVAELVRMRGKTENGKAVYQRSCFVCHRVGDKGFDFGPALTEIGGKLAREAMYTAILDPNEAISFGYEGFEVKTKAGATLIGYIASESDDELGMKVPGGALVTTKKSDIESKTALPVSLMPAGLVATMSQADLVDLVEYLMTLKG